jgi:hypothetical protein
MTNAILTDAELDTVSGGRGPNQNMDMWSPPLSQMNPFQYARAYWSVAGFVGTFRDFAWQLQN